MAVYDITDTESFDKVEQLIEYYKEESEATLPFNIVLVGNKSDLEADRKVPTLRGQQLAEKYGIPFYEASVKEDSNIDDVFYTVAANAIKGNKTTDESMNKKLTQLNDNLRSKNQGKKKNCC